MMVRQRIWDHFVLQAGIKGYWISWANIDSKQFYFRQVKINQLPWKVCIEVLERCRHSIANHTFSHPDFNSEKNGLKNFERNCCAMMILLNNTPITFNTLDFFIWKKEIYRVADGFRAILRNHGYQNGHVNCRCLTGIFLPIVEKVER